MSTAKSSIMNALEIPFTEFEGLVSSATDQIMVDASQLGDMFRPFYENGLELRRLDMETRIEMDKDLLSEWREEIRAKKQELRAEMDRLGLKKGDFLPKELWRSFAAIANGIEWGVRLKAEIEEAEFSMDKETELVEEEVCTMYSFLEMYIDRFSIGTLATIMDVLESLHMSKEISWWNYIQCGLAVCSRLAYSCPKGGWSDTLDNLRKHNNTNHRKTSSFEDRFFGEMSLGGIEDAIDQMRVVRELAERNFMSVEEMWFQLQEERESKFMDPMFVETMEEEKDFDSWEEFFEDVEV